MYNIDYKNVKANYKFFAIFFAIGMIFVLIFGYFCFGGLIKKLGKYGKADCSQVDIETFYDDEDGTTTYKPTFYYEVDGQEYAYTLPYSTNVNPQGMQNNKYMYYDINDPSACVSEYETDIGGVHIFVMLFASIFPTIGICGIVSTYKKVQKLKYLEENGTLIRGLPYRMVESETRINGEVLPAILVEYTLPSGETVELLGDARYDFRTRDTDGLVDLLIDLNNPSNYHIDFDIQ